MRASGIVLPIFSLPSNEGIGTLGESAFNFIDFLCDSHQQYWQLPPVNHVTDISPYSNYCVFSGNYFFIDIKKLVDQNLLDRRSYKKYLQHFKYATKNKIDYYNVYLYKYEVLRMSFFQSFNKLKTKINEFMDENSYWIEDYALFMALKNFIFQNIPWPKWDLSIRNRKRNIINSYKMKLRDQMDFFIFLQYIFYSQWFELKRYANSKNIKIIGEMPLYCNLNSCDVWARPSLFLIDDNFNQNEKLYYNNKFLYKKYCLEDKVLYNIDNLKKSYYRFFIRLLSCLFNMYDELIIDNFDQYNKFKSINVNQVDKNNPVITEHEGIKNELFDIIHDLYPAHKVILSDLDLSDKFLDTYGLPISKIMTQGFSDGYNEPFLPHNYKASDVIYISDYIKMPLKKWKHSISGMKKYYCYKYINNSLRRNFNNDFISKASQSAADIILIPMQDILNIGAKGILFNDRKHAHNWAWRISNKHLNKSISLKLKNFSMFYER